MRILVVDDDPYIIELVKFMLEPEGFNLKSCSNVDDAIEVLAENKFDIVISDIVMPEKDGTKLACHVKETNPSTPVLAITAGIENALDDYVHYADMFADETLTKPFTKDNLVAAIKRLTST